MNACFSILVGMAVLQADPSAPAAPPAEEPNRISQVGMQYPPYPQGPYMGECQNGACYCNQCNECDDDDECEDPHLKGAGCYCFCRSTCDMPPHFAYPPKYHGYYYFLPYNYSHVLRDMEAVKALNGDPRMPYATSMFQSVYSEGVYEEAAGMNRVPMPFPTVTKTLPDLQQLLKE